MRTDGAEPDRSEGEPRKISRRKLAKGLAWSVPAVIMSTPAPAAAETIDSPIAHLSDLDALSATFATRGLPQRTFQLVDEIKRGKGGRIGTGGRAVVSLRYDHYLDDFRSTLAPLLRSRFLPFSIGVVTQSIGQPTGGPTGYEPTNTTWAQVESEILAWGGELWAHSRTHGDPTNGDYEGEIAGSKSDIEQALPRARVMGWQQPGGPCTYYIPHTSTAGMDDAAGRVIRETFGLYETYIGGTSYRMLPTDGCWGYGHRTVDSVPLKAAKGYIDEVIALGQGVQLMTHAKYIGKPSYMTVADYSALLDYIVAKRDSGEIEVLTASGLAFADPAVHQRVNLVPDSSFEFSTSSAVPVGYFPPGPAWTIQTDGGHSGARYLRIPNGSSTVTVSRPTGEYGMDGHTFEFKGWARSLDAVPPHWRVGMSGADSYTTHTNLSIRNAYGALTSTWQLVRFVATLPKGYASAFFTFGKDSVAGTVDWDDLSVTPV